MLRFAQHDRAGGWTPARSFKLPNCYHKQQNGCALFTRLGYFVIIAIIVAAVLAIAFVVWSSLSSSDTPAASRPPATATAPRVEISPAAQPTIPFSRAIDFARLGAVQSIDAQGQEVTVTFREDFDTSGFNTTSHVFRSSLEPGQDIIQVLENAGIRVNGAGGVAVTKR